jgi:hypothetical protein
VFKIFLFFWKKSGLSQAEFIHYYETHHAPLGARIAGPTLDYRRNYPQWTESACHELGNFDAITELWQRDRAAFEEQLRVAQAPAVQAVLAEDEERFMNREHRVFLAVDEVRDGVGEDKYRDGTQAGLSKRMRFLRAPAGMAKEEFRRLYERDAVPEVRSQTPGIIDYRRNYARYEDVYTFLAHGDTTNPIPPRERRFLLIEEIWCEAGELGTNAPVTPMPQTSGEPLCGSLGFAVEMREYRSPGGTPCAPFKSGE